jgi:hypothetical protein
MFLLKSIEKLLAFQISFHSAFVLTLRVLSSGRVSIMSSPDFIYFKLGRLETKAIY